MLVVSTDCLAGTSESMSMAPSKFSLPAATPWRHRFGATLMLVAMALLTALFWAGVIHLILTT